MTVLSKPAIYPGMVFWLKSKSECELLDSEATARCGLQEKAFSHPVMIIDTLEDDSHSYVWVAVMTSTWNANFETLPILYHRFVNGRLVLSECAGCRGKHTKGDTDEMLFHVVDEARMNQHGHVSSEKVYEISIKMIRQERREPEFGHYRVDYRSTELVREKLAKAMDQLSKTSYALKKWPRPVPHDWTDLPKPVPDHDPNAGYYDGMTPFAPDALATPDLSLTRQSSNASTTDSFVTTTSTQPSTAASSPMCLSDSGEADPASSVANEKSSPASSKNNTNQSEAHGQTDIMSRPTLNLSTAFKPGEVKWFQAAAPANNKQRYNYLLKPENRPCIVLDYNETTGCVQYVAMTTFGGDPDDGVLNPQPTNTYARWLPIVRNDMPASQTPRSLYIVGNLLTKGKRISFVDGGKILEAPISKFKTPTEGQDRLTEESLARLLVKVEKKLLEKKTPDQTVPKQDTTSATARTISTKITDYFGYSSIKLADIKSASTSTELVLRSRTASKPSTSAGAVSPVPATHDTVVGALPTPAAIAANAASNTGSAPATTAKEALNPQCSFDPQAALEILSARFAELMGKDLTEKARMDLAKIGG